MDENRFKSIFGRTEWAERLLVHAFIVDVKRSGDEFILMLELLYNNGKNVSPALFRGDLRQINELFDVTEPDSLEGQWRSFNLDKTVRGAPLVFLLRSLSDPEGEAYSIQSKIETPRTLIEAYSIPVGLVASIQDIELFLLNAAPYQENMRLGVLDVGQGSAAFLYHSNNSCLIPTLYIDIGGGCGYNAKTLPAGGIKWCFTQKPGILLSHWHWDHWAGATYGDTKDALKAFWLVPSTAPGPLGRKLAESVAKAGGKIMHWPAGANPVVINQLVVGEATGSRWNDSGLVLLAELESGRFTLAPGDAAYKFIPPSLYQPKLQTLLISHHGGHVDANPPAAIPLPDGMPDCHAYCSVGDQNTYGHPSILNAYVKAGWDIVRTDSRLIGQTGINYYAISGDKLKGKILPCCGGICSLILST